MYEFESYSMLRCVEVSRVNIDFRIIDQYVYLVMFNMGNRCGKCSAILRLKFIFYCDIIFELCVELFWIQLLEGDLIIIMKVY